MKLTMYNRLMDKIELEIIEVTEHKSRDTQTIFATVEAKTNIGTVKIDELGYVIDETRAIIGKIMPFSPAFFKEIVDLQQEKP